MSCSGAAIAPNHPGNIAKIYRPKNKGEGLSQSGATDVIDKAGLDRLIMF